MAAAASDGMVGVKADTLSPAQPLSSVDGEKAGEERERDHADIAEEEAGGAEEGAAAPELGESSAVEDDGIDVGGGWFRYWDTAEQSHYYYNMNTEETVWVLPDECREQEALAANTAEEEQGAAWKNMYNGLAYPADAWKKPEAEAVSSWPPQNTELSHDSKEQHDDSKPAVSSGYDNPEGYTAAPASKYPDGYDWDWYASAHGFPSGHAAYTKYYGVEPWETAAGQQGVQETGSWPTSAEAITALQAQACDPGELTEAQKIFGTDKTFTKAIVHRGLMEAAAKEAGIELDPKIRKSNVLARVCGQAGIELDPEMNASQEWTPENHVQMMAQARPDSVEYAADYSQAATFNKRTGRFERAGQGPDKMPVGDMRRQTRHYFDYDKWAESKATGGGKGTKKAKYL